MVLEGFSYFSPKGFLGPSEIPRTEILYPGNSQKYPLARDRSDSRDFIQERFRVGFFARAAIVVDGESMGFIAYLLEQHQFCRSLLQKDRVGLFREKDFFDSFRERDDRGDLII